MEALRTSIRDEVLEQVRTLISLQPVNEASQPNLSALSVALKNIDMANLNIKFFGYDLARRLAADLPVRQDTSARHVGLQSKASTQVDMEGDWVAHWCGQLLTPVVFHRKMWELSYVLQAIYENGHMREGARGLGFGCGQEPIPSYLASKGVRVTVTDLASDEARAAGWAASHQHATSLDQAFQSHMLSREAFDRLVDLRFVDMTAIPDDLTDYDFCWSVCALEHLGSIAKGLDCVENSLATVRPGGLSVHTTEFNISPGDATIDNWPTVLFQRRHFSALAERLRSLGHHVAELNFDIGDRPLDRFIDLPPWGHDLPAEYGHWHGHGAHLKLGIDGFPSTCFGLLVRKAEG